MKEKTTKKAWMYQAKTLLFVQSYTFYGVGHL
jgi:hypothetical protein